MRAPLFALVASLPLIGGGAVGAQEQSSSTREAGIHRISGDVYALDKLNGSGNVVVLVGGDGFVLVDAAGESEHQMILATLKKLSSKPVLFVIDTHCHGDHTDGNAAFRRDGAAIIAHRNVRERLATQSHCGPPAGEALPTVTFDNELTLHVDDEEVRIIKLPVGHTDGDVMVYFKKANVVATGDAFMSNMLPSASGTEGGTMLGVIDELRKIIDVAPEDAKVIPGHGAQASIADVRRSLQTLEGMRDAIQRQVHAGKTLDEIKKANVLSPWKDAFGEPCIPHTPCDHLDAEFYLNMFYTAFTQVRAP